MQITEAVLRLDPNSEIKVATFMPDLDALTAEFPETGNLLP